MSSWPTISDGHQQVRSPDSYTTSSPHDRASERSGLSTRTLFLRAQRGNYGGGALGNYARGNTSGKVTRHRLNRGGDHQANRALWHIVITRLASDPDTQAYMECRLKEGRSKREIIRILKMACVAGTPSIGYADRRNRAIGIGGGPECGS
jgi:hypothetical protein